MELARRVQNLPPYLFAEVDKMIAKARATGVDVISFGIGDPDKPTPEHIVEAGMKAMKDPSTHSYPSYVGLELYRQAIADYYQHRFNVILDPQTEVLGLIGSKEGIAHLPWALLNPGDISLVPDPAYPVYKTATILCNAVPYLLPLKEENSYLPDLDEIDHQIAKRAKLMYLNYPNNPTGAIAHREFFEEVIYFAYEYDIVVAHDIAYADIYFGKERPISILEIPKAKEVAVEFYSLSKTYNMTGWRIAAFVGNSEIVNALGRVKSNIDSGIFEAVQYAGIEALTNSQDSVTQINKRYQQRRDLVISYLEELGWEITPNSATFYLWIPVPTGHDSQSFSKYVFERTGVFFTPGVGYGVEGEQKVRLALTISEDRIHEAFERLKKEGITFF